MTSYWTFTSITCRRMARHWYEIFAFIISIMIKTTIPTMSCPWWTASKWWITPASYFRVCLWTSPVSCLSIWVCYDKSLICFPYPICVWTINKSCPRHHDSLVNSFLISVVVINAPCNRYLITSGIIKVKIDMSILGIFEIALKLTIGMTAYPAK